MDDYVTGVIKIQGEFTWHSHADTDELFFVVEGELTIQVLHGDVAVGAGQLFVVPRGVEGCPLGEGEVQASARRTQRSGQHRGRRGSSHGQVRRLTA